MKVAKKVKLLSKDSKGNYLKDGANEVLRQRAVVLDESVKETELSYKETGILWVVDEKATKEWQESKQPKKQVRKKTEQITKKEDK